MEETTTGTTAGTAGESGGAAGDASSRFGKAKDYARDKYDAASDAMKDQYNRVREKVEDVDYKNTTRLRKFISDRGKILPRRTTGTCATHQRILAHSIKRAREIALLPFTSE